MKFRTNVFRAVLALIAASCLPLTAHAQFDTRSNVPTKITADSADYQSDRTILTGAVDVRQGDVRIIADKMTVFTSGAGGLDAGSFDKIIAEGNFYYLTSDQEVRGENGVYTKENETFVVSGDVILKQADGNVVTGDKLFYNLKTESARVVGTCSGRKCGATGRVNILIKNTDSDPDGNT
jgi:lipopolysaccharide export system protein LptA